jgi:release factor glutamine methyltransferase
LIASAAALAAITAQLKAAGIEEPRREARLILAAALDTNSAGLMARDTVDEGAYESLVARRAAREPLAYITGHKEFWGLEFAVSPATLIPRADTETLVEAVLESRLHPRTVLDLGAGTGCLLLAVLHEMPEAFGVGVDINPEATALAQRNAQALGLSNRAAFLAGSWAEALEAQFDLILSNPPYIEQADLAGLMPEVTAYEPAAALDGGADGLTAYRAIIAALPRNLAPNGLAVLELGAGQAKSVTALAAASGFAATLRQDLAGIERALLLKFCK